MHSQTQTVAGPKTPTRKQIHAYRKAVSSGSPVARGKKNTLSCLTPRTKPHGQSASKIFCLKLATENAYPKEAELHKLVLDCLKKGLGSAEDLDFILKRFKDDPIYATLIVDVVCLVQYSCLL